MSKSRGNVVNPDDLIVQYGTDCIRAYVMFLGRWEQGGPVEFVEPGRYSEIFEPRVAYSS